MKILILNFGLAVALLGSPLTLAAQSDGSALSERIRNAAPHDTVLVPSGTYNISQTIVLDKPIVLVGDGDPVLRGSGDVEIVHIAADSITVRGLTLQNVQRSFVEDRTALRIEDAAHCEVEGNTILDSFFGIYLASVANCDVTNNRIIGSGPTETLSGNAIHAWYCRDVVIRDNYVTKHRDGIYFEFVEDSSVENNESEFNLRYGLHFMFSDRSSYSGNTFNSNEGGIAVMFSEEVLIRENQFINNTGPAAYGLLLKEIDRSEISNNTFSGNSIGLYMEGSDSPIIQGNVFRRNGWGLKMMSNCDNVSLLSNDFVQNSFDLTTNNRSAVAEIGGNYWDKYEGYDLDRDGVGDVPHRPVGLFAVIAEKNELAVVTLRGFFVRLLDSLERVVPKSTPQFLVDNTPQMESVNQ